MCKMTENGQAKDKQEEAPLEEEAPQDKSNTTRRRMDDLCMEIFEVEFFIFQSHYVLMDFYL